MGIKIIVDSASDISLEDAKKLGIEMLSIAVTFEDKEYYDGIDLLPNDFYEKLVRSKKLPKTSQITPFRFEDKIEKLINQGDEVIVITLSSKLSNTYTNAMMACEKFKGKAFAIDSLSVAAGERLLCLYALELINKGLLINEIVDRLNEVKNKITIIAALDTLTYLKKGGRISATTAFAGELLSIKPIVSVIDGEVKMIDKARGTKKVHKLIDDLVNNNGGINQNYPCFFIYSGVDDSNLSKYLESSKISELTKNYSICQIGSTIGTHIGPGAVGIIFIKN